MPLNTQAVAAVEQHYRDVRQSIDRTVAVFRDEVKAMDDATFLREQPATGFILAWMRDYLRHLSMIGKLFGRPRRPAAGDEFSGVVGVALGMYLEAQGFDREKCIQGEKAIVGRTRPDISVCRPETEQPVAAIECKTNLGYNREGWKAQQEGRTAALQAQHPGCLSFLVILTAANWKYGVLKADPRKGREWFCLSREWQALISSPLKPDKVWTPIEPMFLQIRDALRAG